jgi:DegV family protein with EDD domain
MIKIVTDSTSYLPPALVNEHDIRIVPMVLMFGTEGYREGIDMDAEVFFQRLSQSPGFPTTSQPSSEAFLSAWQPLLQAGHEIVSIFLSSGLSSTVAAAQSVAQLLPTGKLISVLDSHSIAMGLGMQVLRAAELARQGAKRAQIVSAVEQMREAIQIVLTLDSLEFVHRGGRIGKAKALLGTLLNVKPLLALERGILEPIGQIRTTGRAISRLLDMTIQYLGDDRRPWIAVMHSRSPDRAQEMMETLKARFPGARFFFSEIGPVLGAHLGPGGVGIIACPSGAL